MFAPRFASVLFLVGMSGAVAGAGCAGCDGTTDVERLVAQPVAGDVVNFGDIYPGFFFLQSGTVRNEGTAPMRIEFVRFLDPAFSLGEAAPASVAPGESTTLVLRAEPSAIGALVSTVDIGTDAGTVTLQLVATVTEPPVCDDDNPCTNDELRSREIGGAECVHEQREGTCDDGNACTVDTVCVLGVCTGEALECDDGIPCTIDLCQANTGCVFEPDNTQCVDADPCTDDVCTATGCTFPTAVDYSPCGDVACDVAQLCVGGVCQELPGFDGLPCDDGIEGSVGAVCEDGICLEGDVAPNVQIVWSNADHTDLFYDVTSVSVLEDDEVAITTRQQGREDAVHVLSRNGDKYEGVVDNLFGDARFHAIGNGRFVRVHPGETQGRAMIEVVEKTGPTSFTVESQTSINVDVPRSAQEGIASWDSGVAFCAGTIDANGTWSPLDLVRYDLSTPLQPSRLPNIVPTLDPCRGEEEFFFANASGDFMAVGGDNGGFLGEAVFFFTISADGVQRIGSIDGRWRNTVIGQNTFVFQRVDDDQWYYALRNPTAIGSAFLAGPLTSACLAQARIRPFLASDGRTLWATDDGAGQSTSLCRIDTPTPGGIDERQLWEVLPEGPFGQEPTGVVSGNSAVYWVGEDDDNRTIGTLRRLDLSIPAIRTAPNQGQVWDLRKDEAGNVLLSANTQGLVLSQDALRDPAVPGFSRGVLEGGVVPETVASVSLYTGQTDNSVGLAHYTPPVAGHCDPLSFNTCFAPSNFGVELGRQFISFHSTGAASGSLPTGSGAVYSSATKINRCVGIGQSAQLGDIGALSSTETLDVISLCEPGSVTALTEFSPLPGEFLRLRDTFSHGDSVATADVVYVTPASSTPYAAQMHLLSLAGPSPLELATLEVGLDAFATSAAYDENNRIWAVVEQPFATAQTTLTVVNVASAVEPLTLELGVMSVEHPTRVLLVHEQFVYVAGVLASGAPQAVDVQIPFLKVFKLVNDTLFFVSEAPQARLITALLPLDDGSILAADSTGWQTFILEPLPD